MFLRKALFAALVGTALAAMPGQAAAQEKGMNQALSATAHADAVAGSQNGKSQVDRSEKPSGIARVFGGLPLPPGIRRIFGGEEAPPEPPVEEPTDQPTGDAGGDAGTCTDFDQIFGTCT